MRSVPRTALLSAAPNSRRFRRRWPDTRLRRHVCPVGSEALGRGPGRRRRHDRRCRIDRSTFFGMAASGFHRPERGTNLFDGGAPFYAIYECADGKYLSVAPIEGISTLVSSNIWASPTPTCLRSTTGSAGLNSANGSLPCSHPNPRRVGGRLRDHRLLRGTGADLRRGRVYGHHLDRGTFVDDTELAVIPGSRTPGELTGRSPSWPGADTDEVLLAAGWSTTIASLRRRCDRRLGAPFRPAGRGRRERILGPVMLRIAASQLPTDLHALRPERHEILGHLDGSVSG